MCSDRTVYRLLESKRVRAFSTQTTLAELYRKVTDASRAVTFHQDARGPGSFGQIVGGTRRLLSSNEIWTPATRMNVSCVNLHSTSISTVSHVTLLGNYISAALELSGKLWVLWVWVLLPSNNLIKKEKHIGESFFCVHQRLLQRALCLIALWACGLYWSTPLLWLLPHLLLWKTSNPARESLEIQTFICQLLLFLKLHNQVCRGYRFFLEKLVVCFGKK